MPLPPTEPLDAGLTPEPSNNLSETLEEESPFANMPQAPEGYFETGSPASRWFERELGLAGCGCLLLLAASVGAYLWLQRRNRVFFQEGDLLPQLFGVLGLWAARLRIPWQPSQTPLERAAQFNEKLPEAAPAVDTIAGLFVAQQYGRQEPPPGVLAKVIESWRSLQPRLWRQWVLGEVRSRTSERTRKP